MTIPYKAVTLYPRLVLVLSDSEHHSQVIVVNQTARLGRILKS